MPLLYTISHENRRTTNAKLGTLQRPLNQPQSVTPRQYTGSVLDAFSATSTGSFALKWSVIAWRGQAESQTYLSMANPPSVKHAFKSCKVKLDKTCFE